MGGAYFVKYSGPAATPELVIEADHAARRMRPSGLAARIAIPDRRRRSGGRARAPRNPSDRCRHRPFESHDELALTRFGHLDGEREHLDGHVEAGCREHGDIKLRRLLQPIRKSTRLSPMVSFPCSLPTHILPLKVQSVPVENLKPSESSKKNEPKGVPSRRSQPGDTISRQTTGPPLRRYASLQSHRHLCPIDGRGRRRLIRVKET